MSIITLSDATFIRTNTIHTAMDNEARDIIGDFTREVSRDHVNHHDATSVNDNDVQELAQAWVQERSVHEILPSRDDLVQRIIAKVQRSQRVLEEQSADTSGHPLESDKTRAVLVEAELERVQFLLRAYTRARINKAQDHFTRGKDIYDDRSEGRLLTEDERAYARARLQLVRSVLGEEEEEGEADEDEQNREGQGEEHVIARDRTGRVQAVKWKSVQAAVLRGDAELV